jgi:hypothetical protein
MSETFFSDAEAFESGQAYVVRSEIARGRRSSGPRRPRSSRRTHGRWRGVSTCSSARGSTSSASRVGEVALNEEWLELTGLDNRDVGPSWMRLSPRVGFRWDMQDRHEWVVSGSGGLLRHQRPAAAGGLDRR